MIEAGALRFALILARVASFTMVLPLFGSQRMPRLVKVGLAVALGVLCFGSCGPVPLAAGLRGGAAVPWLAVAVALAREALLGALLGYVFGLFLLPARIAGAFVGQEMGLALANVADPEAANMSNVVAELFEAIAVLVFFGLNIHHVFFGLLYASFDRWPIGGYGASPSAGLAVDGLQAAHEWALLLAAPMLVCLFVTIVVLTLMARAAPQLNLLTVGFSLRLAVGLLAAVVLMPQVVWGLAGLFGRAARVLVQLG